MSVCMSLNVTAYNASLLGTPVTLNLHAHTWQGGMELELPDRVGTFHFTPACEVLIDGASGNAAYLKMLNEEEDAFVENIARGGVDGDLSRNLLVALRGMTARDDVSKVNSPFVCMCVCVCLLVKSVSFFPPPPPCHPLSPSCLYLQAKLSFPPRHSVLLIRARTSHHPNFSFPRPSVQLPTHDGDEELENCVFAALVKHTGASGDAARYAATLEAGTQAKSPNSKRPGLSLSVTTCPDLLADLWKQARGTRSWVFFKQREAVTNASDDTVSKKGASTSGPRDCVVWMRACVFFFGGGIFAGARTLIRLRIPLPCQVTAHRRRARLPRPPAAPATRHWGPHRAETRPQPRLRSRRI